MDSIQFTQLFSAILDPDSIISDPNLKLAYETDWRNRYHGIALGVLLPNSVEQICQIVTICQKRKIAIIPQGGNTSLCGASVPATQSHQLQVIINLRNLNKILAFDPISQNLTVEAGCTLKQVADFAKEHNLYFPLSIGAEGTCQIGGNIATNAGGIHVVKYGMMRNLVLGLEAVLANGQVIDQTNVLIKNNTYLDLKQLFIGSEGTLGIVTKINLRLYPQPTNFCTVLLGVTNLTQGLNLFNSLKSQFNLAAFEVINKATQDIYNQGFPEDILSISNQWVILFELETLVDFNLNYLTDLLLIHEIDLEQVIIASSLAEREHLWSFRGHIPLAEKKSGPMIKHDIALPLCKIETFLKQNQKNLLAKYPDINIIVFGHLGDGNLHYNIQVAKAIQTETEQHEAVINAIVYEDVYVNGGTFSAEHGVGQLKKTYYAKYTDPISYNIAKAIKHLFDPENLFNPGKIFNS